MKKLILIPIILLLSSCYTVKNAKRDLDKINRNYPKVTLDYCAKEFPVRIDFKKGDPVIQRDTVTVKGDSVECPPQQIDTNTGKGKPNKVKCPDQKIVYTNTHTTDTFWGENTAELAKKDSLIVVAQRSEEKAVERLRVGYWIMGILALIILVIAAIGRIRKYT